MFEQLNKQLAKVKNLQHKRKKWRGQIADYEAELEEKQQEAAHLKSIIEENKEDVEKLEEMSFAHLLAVFTGGADEQIRQKEKEIATSKLKYDDTQRALKDIKQSIQDIQEKIADLPEIDMVYDAIIERKEELIVEGYSIMRSRYNELSEEIADLQSFLTEAADSIDAGEQVSSALSEAIDELKDAKRWGAFDLFGGGPFVTYAKHNQIDDAKEYIHRAQTKMRLFQKELLDIEPDADVEISSLLTFANYVFDGVFINYVVQGEIEDSLEKVQQYQSDVDRIIVGLNFRYNRKKKALDHLEKQMQTLLETSEY